MTLRIILIVTIYLSEGTFLLAYVTMRGFIHRLLLYGIIITFSVVCILLFLIKSTIKVQLPRHWL